MIAIDTSALMAIMLGEAEADSCARALEAENDLIISSGTEAEPLIVSARRNVGQEMARLIDGLGLEIDTVTAASERYVARAYENWGKGHPPALNFGDCFAYEVAKEHACRLLYVGDDSSKTDILGVL
jgi:ribonuclease VapC